MKFLKFVFFLILFITYILSLVNVKYCLLYFGKIWIKCAILRLFLPFFAHFRLNFGAKNRHFYSYAKSLGRPCCRQ